MQMLIPILQKRQRVISERIGSVFSRDQLVDAIETLQREMGFSDATKARLYSSAKLLNGDWGTWKEGRLYCFNDPYDVIEILQALSKRPGHYISHYTAMYYHGLIEQRPHDHFITHEIVGKSSGKITSDLDPFRVRQAFLKPARKTTNCFEFNEQKFSILEKVFFDQIGVEELTTRFENQEFTLKATNIARTFVDAIISPHNCGGITTVISAFHDQDLRTDELLDIYEKINPIYPYWQVIGALLQDFAGNSKAETWSKFFRDRKRIPFYVEHEAKSTWDYSSEWNLYFPKGSLKNVGY